MNIYAPKYYKDFSCIASRCKHSCCKGWEIDIDIDAMKKYAVLTEGYGKEIWNSIDYGEAAHFRLCPDESCPHLDENGLCRIITNLGEDYLCSICREHPRFYNDTARGIEAGLGLCCEEAARIILSSDNYGEFIIIGEGEDFQWTEELDPMPFRDKALALLSDEEKAYDERLEAIGELFTASPADTLTDEHWRETLSSLEYLDEAHRELFSCYSSSKDTPAHLESLLRRALAYFIYRHTSTAGAEAEFEAAMGFCLFCERLLCSILKSDPSLDPAEAARIISEELEYSEDNTDAIKTEFLF